MGCSKRSSKREVYSNTIHFRKQEKDRTDSLNLHLKQLEKEEQNPQKISRRKEIIKIQAEISERNNSKDLKN